MMKSHSSLACRIGSTIGQRTRKRHEDDQSDDRDNDYHDDHFWVAKTLAPNHECSCNIALGGRKCQHRSRILAGTPKQPADAESKRDEQKPRENAAGAKDLENLVEVHNR